MRAVAYTMSLAMVAGCSSYEEKVANNEAQIRMVQVQREAQAKERIAEAEMRKALFEALLGVAKADPSQSGMVAMALAMQGMNGDDDAPNTPILALQQQPNEALQWTQALAPVAGGVLATLGTAIVSGNVQKRQIEATRDVQINQANQTANAIASVAGLGETAVANAGDTVGGNLYSLTDSSFDNSTTSTTTTTTTAITDSYNTDNSDNSTNDYSSVVYEGQEFSLPDLITYLASTGLAYNLTIGDTVYTIDGTGQPVTIDCGAVDFSPPRAECI